MEHDPTIAQLGALATDEITGYEGIITDVAYHVTGCTRIGVRATDNPEEADKTRFFYPTQLTITDDVQENVYSDDPVTSVGFDLGWHLRDRITHAEGIATTVKFSLHNCPRVALTPVPEETPEEPVERFWYDTPRVEVVNRPSDEGLVSSLAEFVNGLRSAGEASTGASASSSSRNRDAE